MGFEALGFSGVLKEAVDKKLVEVVAGSRVSGETGGI
jgi:hypothetical protein